MGRFKYLVLIFILIFALFSYADSTLLDSSLVQDNLSINDSLNQTILTEKILDSNINFPVEKSDSLGVIKESKRKVIVVLKDKAPVVSASSSKLLRSKVLLVPKEKTIDDVIVEQNVSNIENKFSSFSGFTANLSDDEINKLILSGDVEVQEDRVVHAFLQDSVNIIGAKTAWNSSTYGNITGRGQTVCIVDTGVDFTHPFFGSCTNSSFISHTCNKTIGGYDFVNNDVNPYDDQGHGTHVAGIVAANGLLKGIAPDAKIVAVKVLDETGSGSESDVVAGIDYCVNHSVEYNISVISMSLGGDSFDTYCDLDYIGYSASINAAVRKNISVVIATGNDYDSVNIAAPACIQNATRVGSTTKIDSISDFSNRNWMVKLFAPGSDINSSYPGNRYAIMSGTSMATPHVAGAIALFNQYARNNSLNFTPDQIENSLYASGKKIYDISSGNWYSRININSALYNLYLTINNETIENGNGTIDSPFLIRNCTNLNDIRNNLSAHYSIISDLDCSNYTSGNIFSPIGSDSNPFNGTLNGNEYLISNLLINSTSNNTGLFAYVENSSISNLAIFNWTIIGENNSGLISGAISYSNLSNIIVNNGSVTGFDFTGGLVGFAENSQLSNSTCVGTVLGNDNVGGIIGYSNNCTNANLISGAATFGKTDVGGITGFSNNSNYNSTIFIGVTLGMDSVGGSFGKLINTNVNLATGIFDMAIGANSVGGIIGDSVGGNYSNLINVFGFSVGVSEECINLMYLGITNTSLNIDNLTEGDLTACNNYLGTNVGDIIGLSVFDNLENIALGLGVAAGNSSVGGVAGTLENSNLTNAAIDMLGVVGINDVGGLVGFANSSFVDNSSILDSSVSGNNSVGGFIGYFNNGDLKNVSFGNYDYGNFSVSAQNIGSPNFMTKIISTDLFVKLQNTSNVDGIINRNSILLNNFNLISSSSEYFNLNSLSSIKSSDIKILDVSIQGNSSESYAVNGINSVGGIVGMSENSSIFNVSFSLSVNGTYYVGGLVGYQSEMSLINNSYSTGSLNGATYIGGLVGRNFGNITNSYSAVNVNGSTSIGGLVGDQYGGLINNSYAIGNVSSSGNYAGGLIGYFSYDGNIINSYSAGNVTGYQIVGGLIGISSGNISLSYSSGIVNARSSVGGLVGVQDGGFISNSFSSGNVSGLIVVGGLVGLISGDQALINSSFSVGRVIGSGGVGGLVGDNYSNPTVNNSYWDNQTSNQSTSAGGVGKSTAEMKNISTYSVWNFTDFWDRSNNFNSGYPFLRFELVDNSSPAIIDKTPSVELYNIYNNYNFMFEVNDNIRVAETNLSVYLNGNLVNSSFIFVNDSSSYLVNNSFRLDSDGNISYSLFAKDSSGNNITSAVKNLTILRNISNNSLFIINSSFNVSENTSNVILPSSNFTFNLTVPISTNNSVYLNLSYLLENISGNFTTNVSNMTLTRQDNDITVSVYIPGNTTVVGNSNWSGTIQVPEEVNSSSFDSTVGAINSVIFVGGNVNLIFSNPIKIVLQGMHDKKAGWSSSSSGALTTIAILCDNVYLPTNINSVSPKECYGTQGSDLVIWSYHMTYFGAITPSSSGDSGGGSGSGGSSGSGFAPGSSTITLTEDGRAYFFQKGKAMPINIGSSTYTLNVSTVNNKTVVTIFGTPYNITLGNILKVDLNGDLVYDMSLNYSSDMGTIVNFFLAKINEPYTLPVIEKSAPVNSLGNPTLGNPIDVPAPAINSNPNGALNSGATNTTSEGKANSKLSVLNIILILVLFAIFIAILFQVYMKFQNKKVEKKKELNSFSEASAKVSSNTNDINFASASVAKSAESSTAVKVESDNILTENKNAQNVADLSLATKIETDASKDLEKVKSILKNSTSSLQDNELPELEAYVSESDKSSVQRKTAESIPLINPLKSVNTKDVYLDNKKNVLKKVVKKSSVNSKLPVSKSVSKPLSKSVIAVKSTKSVKSASSYKNAKNVKADSRNTSKTKKK